ncbi:hypothetical protein IQ250_21500 [Pseudanabaenaceae cyanobacterium LEGE 13415]|nr:hypothetical protein [Pseudanabaenaceae cyanobacterium LEGE 13415]
MAISRREEDVIPAIQNGFKAMTAYVLLTNHFVPLFIEHWEMLTDPSLLESIRKFLPLS